VPGFDLALAALVVRAAPELCPMTITPPTGIAPIRRRAQDGVTP
jgi:hypothetical protein